jgi:tRNA dimethylallyltransferase
VPQRAVIIAGPTGGGKSAAAIRLARLEDGVIINADSLQVYNALHTLTAHPSQEEMEQATHRLYSWLAPDEACSAIRWRDAALAEMRNAVLDGRLPIVVGGTGLYIKSLIEGLSPIPNVPPEVRERGNALQAEVGNPEFHRLLRARDPLMAARLHPNDTQRLIRAWEVFEATGKSLAEWQEAPPEDNALADSFRYDIKILSLPREELRRRCDMRFELMMEHGAMSEVRELDAEINAGRLEENAPVTQALGFRPLREALHGGITLDVAIERAKLDTKQYAKRQDTWFRNQIQPHPRVASIEAI